MIADVVDYINSSNGTYADRVKSYMRYRKVSLADKIPGVDSEQEDTAIHYDYTPYCMRKRVEGTVFGITEAQKRLSNITSPSHLEAYFIFANSLGMKGGYNDDIDYFNIIARSSAVWILDELTLSGKIEEIYQYLQPLDDEQYKENFFFPMIHPMYEDPLIDELTYLIRHRNTSKKSAGPSFGSLIWQSDKPDKDEKSKKLREAFNAVIALIDPNSIKSAVQNYENKIWEFYRIAFSIWDAKEKCENKIFKEIEELQHSMNSMLGVAKSQNVLLRQNTVAPPPLLESMPSKDCDKNQIKIKHLENKLDKLEHVTLTCISLPNDREKLAKSLKGVIPAALAEELISFHVTDPFESAFALLYLMDQKSLTPWFYYGSISVAYTLRDQLPFDTIIKQHAKPVRISEWDDALYQHRYKGYRFSDRTDASGSPVEREYAKNLSQLIFTNTLSLIPRVAPELANMADFLAEFGELTEREKEAYSLLSYALVSGQIRAYSVSEYQFEEEIKQEFEENTTPDESEEDSAQLAAENKRLRERNKELIERLASTLASRREDGKQIYSLRRRFEQQEKELSDLREAVFALENSTEQEVSVDTSIHYPYMTDGKIVSFGGHQTWLNEMRKKLPNVTFVGPDFLPNIELIRNADVVWLQTNCMPHSNFFRIINVIRQAEIPLRYFTYTGTDKCAEQIVRSTKNQK
jgi:hypothetical protein